MTDSFTLDRSALRRLGTETRKSELRPTDVRERQRDPQHQLPTVARFQLLTPLEDGKSASARFLSLENTDEPGEYEWVPTDHEVTLHAAPGVYNHLPEGAEVTAERTASGWRAGMHELWGVLPGGFEPCPYAVLRMSHLSNSCKDAIQLTRPGSGGIVLWDDDYAFTTAAVPGSTTGDTLPDEGAKPRMIPCTPLLPAKVAYKQFDGLLPGGEPIPDSILQAMNQGPHPATGQLWGPTHEGKLSRTVTFLELFWWEWCSPAWECITFTEPNPDYDPSDPDETDPPTIEVDYWGIPAECNNGNSPINSGIPCDEDPPERRSAFWVSPYGWWGLGTWNWNWWSGLGWWRYGYPYSGYFPNHVWGPWGHGWWTRWWGGRPPTPDDMLELPGSDPPPDPPCGGLIQRHRYGFIVWEFGWRVLGADTDAVVATIVGEIQFRNQLVVENADVPESSCDNGYGYGGS